MQHMQQVCPMTLLQSSHKQKNWMETAKKRFLDGFLERHGFADEWSPRAVAENGNEKIEARGLQMECIYPIHVAAQLGDVSILRMLLDMGVDPLTGAADGRTPRDFAEEANQDGSHARVLQLLADKQKVKSVAL